MAGNIKGITIEFDGDVSKLQKSLKQLDKATGDVDKKLRAINKSLRFNPGNTELIAQKQKALADKIGATEKKLTGLKNADKELKTQLANGKLGQDKYDELQREIIETESKLSHFKGQIAQLNMAPIDKLGKKFQALGNSIKNAGSKISNFGSNLTMKVTAPIMAISTAGFNLAAELEDAMGASDQIFKNSAKEVQDWADKLDASYGIAEGEALSYANTMGAMLKNIGGLSEEEASKQSQTLTELAGDLSAMFGGSTETAVQALTNALKGNTSMLDNYGMGVNDATIKQKAFEMGIYKGKGALGMQEKQAATLALIMEQTADAQGQAGREAEGASGSMKTLTTTIKKLGEDIGQILIPIFVPMINKVKEMVTKFKELDPALQQNIVKWGLLAAALGPVLMVIGKFTSGIGSLVSIFGKSISILSAKIVALSQSTGALGTAFQFIAGHFAVIVAGIGLVVGAFITLWNTNETFKNNILAIWELIKQTFTDLVAGIQERLAGLQLAFQNIVAFITPIWLAFCNMLAPAFEVAFFVISTVFTIVKDVILGILDIFIGVFTGNWEQAWNGVKSIFENVWYAIEDFIHYIIEAIGTLIVNGVNFISTTVTSVWNTLKSAVIGIWNAMGGSIGAIWEGIKSTVSSAVNGVKTTVLNVYNTLSTITSTTWDGIKSTISNIWNGIKTVVSSAVNGVKTTVTNVFNGLKSTVSNIWNGIKTAIMTPINGAVNIVKGAIDRIKGLFNFKFSWPKLKMPRFSIKGSMNPLKWLKEGVPKLSVDWYAQGGVFDSPSVIGVGEAGSEAVVPTNKLDKFLSDGVSRVLAGINGQNAGSGITINVQEMNVREDSDIKRVAEEVQRLIDLKMARVSNAGGLL